MGACTGISAIQLLAAAFTFLAAVVSLDVFWVRTPDEVHGSDIADALRKRSWLNALGRRRRRRRRPALLLGQHLLEWRLLNRSSPSSGSV